MKCWPGAGLAVFGGLLARKIGVHRVRQDVRTIRWQIYRYCCRCSASCNVHRSDADNIYSVQPHHRPRRPNPDDIS